ncbi:MAG: beta-galactosidase [Planctomycetota bacterium]
MMLISKPRLARLLLLASVLACATPLLADRLVHGLAPPVTREMLFEPSRGVEARVGHVHGGLSAERVGDGRWAVTGRMTGGAGGVQFVPTGEKWDFTGHSLFSMQMTNAGPGIVRVDVRLENGGAVDWANNSSSQSYLMPGETGVITVGYPLGWRDDSPPAFRGMAAKPNGWRSQWKSFNAADIRICRVTVRSSHPQVRLTGVEPYLAWPTGAEANHAIMVTPYLDRYGQAIPFDWQTKVQDDADLHALREAEAEQLRSDPGPASFNRYGGYAAGPRLEATGYFRTQKVDGKWWLIDPEGRLFWSHGVCTVNNTARTPIRGPRRALFGWLPAPGSDEHRVGMTTHREHGPMLDFLRINTMRKYGPDWEQASLDATHRRMRAWGLNTLGAWSNARMYRQERTPYTEITHIWHGPHSIDGAADPFEPGFEERYREAVGAIAERHGDDPWMLGVFLDNEVHWHNDMVERVLGRGPEQPAYRAFVALLQQRYDDAAALNRAWGTSATDWLSLTPGNTEAWRADRERLYAHLADRYYGVCRQTMDELLPNHLYLGSRVHSCPPIVAQQIAKYVDVFSVNHYWPLAGTGRLPADADLPVMVTEYDFGTIDRGVLGMSLCPVHDQAQRARGYAAYVVAGLMHPKIVGTHWFAYTDQPTVGRPGENYQMGLIDITDTPYPEVTAITRALGERMYPLRLSAQAKLLDEVRALIEATESPPR